MNAKTVVVNDQDLVDYADGQIDATRAQLVEAYIDKHPEAAAKVDAYRGQRQLLHDQFDSILSAPIPKHLLPETAPASNAVKQPHNRIWRYAAMLAMFGIGIGIGWVVHQNSVALPSNGIARPAHILFQQASTAHAAFAPEILHPVEVSAGDIKQLSHWLSDRLGKEITIPDFKAQGFHLIGGRLLPALPGNVAAQLMYENKNKLRLTLYLRKMEQQDPNTSIHYGVTKGIGVTYWIDHDWGYALSGRFDEPEMLKLSEKVYLQSRL